MVEQTRRLVFQSPLCFLCANVSYISAAQMLSKIIDERQTIMTDFYKTQPPEKQRKVLLVDDDDAILRATSHQLTLNGYEVVTAMNAEEAEQIITEDGIEIVICDFAMPGANGLELCRRLRSRPETRSVYFIMFTGYGKNDEKIYALKEGVDDYITKSFDPAELIARVHVAQRIVELQHQVVRLERGQAYTELITTLAHEINNPLTGLLGFLELAKIKLKRLPVSESEIEKVVQMLERTHEQGKRIGTVVEKLMGMKDYKTKTYLETVRLIDLDSAQFPPEI
jgi:CheY-like chemotaxis protein